MRPRAEPGDLQGRRRCVHAVGHVTNAAPVVLGALGGLTATTQPIPRTSMSLGCLGVGVLAAGRWNVRGAFRAMFSCVCGAIGQRQRLLEPAPARAAACDPGPSIRVLVSVRGTGSRETHPQLPCSRSPRTIILQPATASLPSSTSASDSRAQPSLAEAHNPSPHCHDRRLHPPPSQQPRHPTLCP